MDLYIVRHAVAAERDPLAWPDDADRPLTSDGIARFRRAARGLRRIVPEVEAVLSSPYVRAWDTAQILADEAGWPAPTRCDALAADRPPAAAVKALAQRPSLAAVALVGHEPHLGELATLLLVGGAPRPVLELKKGAVVCLQLEGKPRPGSAVLRWVLPPKVLRLLA